MDNISIFDGHVPYYKITKPIRLIELFAGIGSQYQALKNLGANVEHYKICEWQVNSIQAYNDIHVQDYTAYSSDYTKENLVEFLAHFGVSLDYNKPATKEQLNRKSVEWLRKVYDNIRATKNLVNICNVRGGDLEIRETDKYDYILTYSFPCQDLSKAGKGKGMTDSTTRSGLLWEVERLLSECDQLPQILLMENVPDVIGARYIGDFRRWEERLSELGYTNHIATLNAKNFGIPQNRERTFMVSLLGNHQYEFPQGFELKLRLKDMLEKEVDEKYYISEKLLNYFNGTSNGWQRQFRPLTGSEDNCYTITTREGNVAEANYINETKEYANYLTWLDEKGRINTQDHRAYFEDRISGTVPAMERGIPNVLLNQEKTIIIDDTQGFDGIRLYENEVPTLRAERSGLSVLIEQPKVDIIANIRENGISQSGNVYDKEQLSPTLCATDYKNPPKITEPNYNTQAIVIPEDTKQGFALARDGDGVYINRPHQKRGVVQDQMIQTIKTDNGDVGVVVNPIKDKTELRIRKLTPRECYRLMGFKDEQFDKAQENQSNSSLYHQAGDSIVVNVLEAIFKQLL